MVAGQASTRSRGSSATPENAWSRAAPSRAVDGPPAAQPPGPALLHVAVGLQDGHAGLVALLAGEGEPRTVAPGAPPSRRPRLATRITSQQPAPRPACGGAGTGSVAAWVASGSLGLLARWSRPGSARRRPRSGFVAPHPAQGRRPGHGDARTSLRPGLTRPDSAKTTSWARSRAPSLTMARLTLARAVAGLTTSLFGDPRRTARSRPAP